MKDTFLAIALIGATVSAPFAIALTAVASLTEDYTASGFAEQTGNRYRGPESFWSD